MLNNSLKLETHLGRVSYTHTVQSARHPGMTPFNHYAWSLAYCFVHAIYNPQTVLITAMSHTCRPLFVPLSLAGVIFQEPTARQHGESDSSAGTDTRHYTYWDTPEPLPPPGTRPTPGRRVSGWRGPD